MSVETHTYDDGHGDPVVVVVTSGIHDVSRLVHLYTGRGNCEQIDYGHRIVRQLRRHGKGVAALRLLAEHGGTDFTGEAEA